MNKIKRKPISFQITETQLSYDEIKIENEKFRINKTILID